MALLGRKIDNIRITGFLGEGGMGAIYAGFDEKLRRKVALKSIRPDRFGAAAKARFLREARSLSRLSHPNICGIYDYIEGPESDFLVLELIDGEDLRTAFARGIEPAAKLRIAEEVAQALVVAHAKGIVHRDLKMANVMLTEDGSVKVLDFGLAQFTQGSTMTPGEPLVLAGWDPAAAREETQKVAGAPGDTALGVVVGTASCMSPEQARGETVTAASDMYSFGLLLQELATGRPAYDPSLPIDVLMTRVRAGEVQALTGADTDLADLIQRLESVAPEARPTAAEALRRLQWIRDRPRRRLRGLALAAGFLLIVLGLVKYTLDLRRERDAAVQARQEAERSRAEAEDVAGFLENLFAVPDPGHTRGETITAREVLDRGAANIERDLRGQPLRRARMLASIGQTYLKLGLYNRARPLFEQALEARRAGLSENDPGVAQSLRDLGSLDQAQGRFAEAEPLFLRALAIQERTLGPRHSEVAATLNSLGTLYGYQGDLAKAEPLFQRALKIREQAPGAGPSDVAATLNNLAFVKQMQGKSAESEALLRQGLAIREKSLAPDHPDLAANLEALAVLESDLKRYSEAEALHRRALAIWIKTLGPDHPRIALVLANLAKTCAESGQGTEAENLFHQAIALREKILGPDHPDLALALMGLADVYQDERRDHEAETLYRRALGIQEKVLKPGDRSLQETLRQFAKLLRATGRATEAVALEVRETKAKS